MNHTNEQNSAAAAPVVKTWRERIAAGPDFPLHAPNDVERAMEAEIAELRTTMSAALLIGDKHLPGWERGIATVTLSGHQLRAALDLIAPDEDELQLEDELTFGIVQHQDDAGKVSIGICCWNDDTDGVMPLDGEYAAASAAPANLRALIADDAHAATFQSIGQYRGALLKVLVAQNGGAA